MTRPRPAEAWSQLARARKSGAGVPWYMRVVNRRLGRGVAALASPTRLTPNHLTLASFLAFLAGGGLLATVTPGVAMAVGAMLLLQLGFALDSADGQLSRLRGTGSPAGEWLDHVVDSVRHPMFHLAIMIGLFRFSDLPDVALLLPLGFALVSGVRFFAQILAEQLARRDPIAGPESVPRFGTWIQAPVDTGINNFVIVLWPWTVAFMAAYSVLAALNALLLVATMIRRYRELEQLARQKADA